MIEREDIHPQRSALEREQVRQVLLEAWRRRPAAERTPNVAKRFALEAARTHPFACERPRENVILGWIRPHVIVPARRREPTALGRWLNRPWYERSHWPLRLAAVAFLVYVVLQLWTALTAGRTEDGFSWLMLVPLAVVLSALVWIERRPGR